MRHINEVKLCHAQSVPGLVTTFGGSTILVFSRSLRPTQPGYPSVGRCSEYRRWSQRLLGKKRRVLRSSGTCDQDSWHTRISRLKSLAVKLSWLSDRLGLYASLIGSNSHWLKAQ